MYRSDLACCCIPCTGTGVLPVGCTGDHRFLDGNRENSRDNLYHNCDYYPPVWLVVATQRLKDEKNTQFFFNGPR